MKEEMIYHRLRKHVELSFLFEPAIDEHRSKIVQCDTTCKLQIIILDEKHIKRYRKNDGLIDHNSSVCRFMHWAEFLYFLEFTANCSSDKPHQLMLISEVTQYTIYHQCLRQNHHP